MDHFYKKTLKKVVRKTLFQVIQESIDAIYFLEEDAIFTANVVLENLLRSQIKLIASEILKEEIRVVSPRVRFNLESARSTS